ncbi:hypothetical protein TEA_010502 [Camellia sinensis var. sinensis]|uniref:Homogentisate phytyltransferase n=1 Tax=Camellia sinensis var. sinensis TaxID=542762 RepID=A0A4S4EK67_CAMSN|nr:hypothetical protein TEA_010502 [Camellia sinensis var. sinensis]
MIVSSFAILSFCLGWIVGSWPLFWALFISFVLGTAYSINLPLLRWKRFALVAAMCILAVRAVIVQIAFFLHIQTHVYRRHAVFSRPVIFATAFMSFFSVVIALFKDIPDIDGDKLFGIRSFTVRLGQERVFWICIWLLELAYCVAVLVGAVSSCLWSKYITVLGHAILASILWNRAKSLDLKSKAAVTSFYMFIWKLFYAEYLLIPLVMKSQIDLGPTAICNSAELRCLERNAEISEIIGCLCVIAEEEWVRAIGLMTGSDNGSRSRNDNIEATALLNGKHGRECADAKYGDAVEEGSG